MKWILVIRGSTANTLIRLRRFFEKGVKKGDQWQKIRREWAYGTDEFRLQVQGVLDSAVSGKWRDSFMGEEIRMHDEQEAEKLIQQGGDPQ